MYKQVKCKIVGLELITISNQTSYVKRYIFVFEIWWLGNYISCSALKQQGLTIVQLFRKWIIYCEQDILQSNPASPYKAQMKEYYIV